ncbi:hypothetical protein Nos7524_5344 [Nostoc sp. PCC 7524]|uniref:hypothetical protein n=1 Tax=Nostoc sp. (strain ATCC 29411 / PCC 7524) TaxID=28072 RepID=UPI00029F3E25|nr:hypothetical protein [Nostoc sp. PCC 7524]AFY51063.1 hypothetical protein Nos7524_5344 [Nostoc sp. PCC 7524]
MSKQIVKILICCFLLTIIVSCNSDQANKTTSSIDTPGKTTTVTNINESTDKIKFKTEGGTDLFSLKQQADGSKLVDGNNQEIARIKADQSGKIKIKNAQEQVLGYVVTEQGTWKLKNPQQNQDLYSFKRQSDGNYQLEDANKKVVYRIQNNKNGLEIITADKKLAYQVKIKDEKMSLRNPSGRTIFSTKSTMSPIAFACFGLDTLTREQQAALAYAVNLTGGQ